LEDSSVATNDVTPEDFSVLIDGNENNTVSQKDLLTALSSHPGVCTYQWQAAHPKTTGHAKQSEFLIYTSFVPQ